MKKSAKKKAPNPEPLDDCPVCLEVAIPPVTLNPCGHMMCGQCLLLVEKKLAFNCVVCREPIVDYVVSVNARARVLAAITTDDERALDAEFMLQYKGYLGVIATATTHRNALVAEIKTLDNHRARLISAIHLIVVRQEQLEYECETQRERLAELHNEENAQISRIEEIKRRGIARGGAYNADTLLAIAHRAEALARRSGDFECGFLCIPYEERNKCNALEALHALSFEESIGQREHIRVETLSLHSGGNPERSNCQWDDDEGAYVHTVFLAPIQSRSLTPHDLILDIRATSARSSHDAATFTLSVHHDDLRTDTDKHIFRTMFIRPQSMWCGRHTLFERRERPRSAQLEEIHGFRSILPLPDTTKVIILEDSIMGRYVSAHVDDYPEAVYSRELHCYMLERDVVNTMIEQHKDEIYANAVSSSVRLLLRPAPGVRRDALHGTVDVQVQIVCNYNV